MDISSVGPIRPSTPFPVETDKASPGPQTFGELLKDAVNTVNGLQIDANDKALQLALGDIQDTHEVMLAMEKAGMALQLTLEIRNKVMEAYQEVLRQAM